MVGSGSRPGLLHSADGVVPPVRETSFDVAAFVRSAFGDRLREADEDLRPPDLSPDLRGALTYLWDIERSAADTLRRVLATSTSREARYTAFLTTWAHDKYWFADRLHRALGPWAPPRTADRATSTTPRDRWGRALDIVAQHVDPVWTTLLGEPTTGWHAVRGLASESAEIAAVRRVAELAGGTLDPFLVPVLGRKEEHHAFFLAEAHMRLANDAVARRLVRILLTTDFHPLRPGGLAVVDSHRFLRTLFTGGARDQMVREADRDVVALPGARATGPLAAALRRERPVVPPVDASRLNQVGGTRSDAGRAGEAGAALDPVGSPLRDAPSSTRSASEERTEARVDTVRLTHARAATITSTETLTGTRT
ncbi:MAG: hypothetical protein ACTHW4_07210 [Actinomycetales bacterium]